MGKKLINISNKKFGKLLVTKEHILKGKSTYWKCLCECGNIKYIAAGSLRSGATKSCGCLSIEKPNALKHGFARTRFYNIWCNVKARCLNTKSPEFKKYGLKNITICNDWLSFINFKNDMYDLYLKHVEEYGEKETTLDRIDCTGNYEKNNCRWATYQVQAENKIVEIYFVATSPCNKAYISKNQNEFARNNNLCSKSINKILNYPEKRKQHKGWTFRYATNEEIENFKKDKA